ncbi:unnamed protein product [Urochloa humidicola]
MHKGMSSSKEAFFPEPEVIMHDWMTEYLILKGAHGTRSESGLYNMFYGRYFDGKTVTRRLTSESQQLHLCNLLHQMLTVAGNIEEFPSAILNAIGHPI